MNFGKNVRVTFPLIPLDPVNRFNHTSWMATVTLTDRRKSIRNRCVTKVTKSFWWRFCVVTLVFGVSLGVWDFVVGLCPISSFVT